MTEFKDEPWEYSEQLYLLEVLVDDVNVEKDAEYGDETTLLSMSAKVKFLDFPEMEVEPNDLVISHKQRGNEGVKTESEIPGLPSDWEVSLANDLSDFDKFPQYRVKIPVRNQKPLKSYVVSILVPKIAVSAGEGLRYIYTALEKNTNTDVMNSIKAQILNKIEQDKKAGEEEPLPPVKFASGKSCLFRLNAVELINGLKKYPLYITVYRNGIIDSVPVNLLVGQVKVKMGDTFIKSVLEVENSTILPISAHIEEKFDMGDIFGKKTGTVGLFVRLSCFGSSTNPPQVHDYIDQRNGGNVLNEETASKDDCHNVNQRKKPEALLAHEDMSIKPAENICQNTRGPITWRRAGDKLPDIPKPKLATLPSIHQPMPPPPPRKELPFELADHLPGLPRCTPLTPPPCYRRPWDPPISRCEKEMEAQLTREELTKAVQTNTPQPTQRLPPNSPYIDPTVKIDETNNSQKQDSSHWPAESQKQANGPTSPASNNIQESGSGECSPNCSGKQIKVAKQNEVNTIMGKDEANMKPPGESPLKKFPKPVSKENDSELVIQKEGTTAKPKDSELSLHRDTKKCSCQELTPEQKKMNQDPPPCRCKTKGKSHKRDKFDKDKTKKNVCSECERIRLNGNLIRALHKITALEAQHCLTDSKVNEILQEEYSLKGGNYGYQDTEKNKGPSEEKKRDDFEITADERENEMREAFKGIIEAEVAKFEERKKQKQGLTKSEADQPKISSANYDKPNDSEKKKKKRRKVNKRPKADLEEILKWMYPGTNFGHKVCVRPLRLVPKTMGWLWNLSSFSGLLKPGRGWQPGSIRAEVNKSIKEWRKERRVRGGEPTDDEDDMLWGARQKRRPLTPKSPGSRKAESVKYNPTLHMHKKNGFYYISMYPIRSESLDDIADDPKPTMFKISAKQPEGSQVSDGSLDSSSDQESYEIEFVTPSAMRRQIKKPPRSNVSAQYLEEDFLPKTKKKKIEPDAESKKVPPDQPHPKKKDSKKGKGKGKGKKK